MDTKKITKLTKKIISSPWINIQLNHVIYRLLFVYLIIDSINGILIRNYPNIISISQIYKSVLLAIMIASLYFYGEKKIKYIGISFIFLLIGNYYLHGEISASYVIQLSKFYFIPISFLYFKKALENTPSYITKYLRCIKFNYFILLLNLTIGITGISGYSQYVNSIGTRGFFYAGNEVSLLFVVFSTFLLYQTWKANKLFFSVSYIIVLFFAIYLSTKVALISTLFILIIFPLIEKDFIKKMKPERAIGFILFFIANIFIAYYLLGNVGIFNRWTYSYAFHDGSIMATLLSGRNNMLVANMSLIQEGSVLNLLFGYTHDFITVEMDFFDVFLNYGVAGLALVIIFWLQVYKIIIKNNNRLLLFITTLIIGIAFAAGHTLGSGMAGLWIGMIASFAVLPNKEEKTIKNSIFLISNMYPSSESPSYGIFVKNFEEQMLKNGLIITHKALITQKKASKYKKILLYLKFYYEIINKGLSSSYETMYVHYVSHSAIPVLILKGLLTPNKNLVLNFHGGDVFTKTRLSQILNKVAKKVVQRADLVVVPSKFFEHIVSEKYGIHKDKIFISPSSGIDTKLFKKEKQNLRQELNISKTSQIMGYVSRIDAGKGWEIYLQSIKKLIEHQTHLDITGLVIGEGSQKKDFQKKIKKMGLENNILYLGEKPQHKLPKYYSAMDVFVFPTYLNESLGLVGIESMACETPVVGSEVGGLTSYLKNGKNGFIFKPQSSEDLADKLIKFFNLSHAEKQNMLENCKETVKHYDSNVVGQKLSQKLKNINYNKKSRGVTLENRINLLGYSVDALTMEETINKIEQNIKHKSQTQHVVVNASKTVLCQKDKELNKILNECKVVNADGQSIVWAAKLLGKPLPERVAGIDLFLNLVELSETKGYNIYLLGATEETVKKVNSVLKQKYPDLNIVGYRNGYFSKSEEQDILEDISSKAVDMLFVAFGSPKQEKWAYRNLSKTNALFCMGVGGSFDVLAGINKRAPIFMQKAGLEWFHRFLQEPRRMWKRCFIDNSKFVFLLLKEFVSKK
ncbi:WecB/TagA/CpsF family glycosyltransferase [Proteinivorax tanatarense]|uniref:WecB/TagA/CpsF family glycosyltransferase n=1 Tax=Proteinivorax tanatarense TaxID=1260629 RepID=A0AAU7VIH1_9FIRM